MVDGGRMFKMIISARVVLSVALVLLILTRLMENLSTCPF